MAELVGYARVTTLDQHPEMQVDALHAAGCVRIFEEKASGAKSDRPQLAACLEYLRPGDTLVVWSLDRLGRNLLDLITRVQQLQGRDVQFRSLRESIDTATAAASNGGWSASSKALTQGASVYAQATANSVTANSGPVTVQ